MVKLTNKKRLEWAIKRYDVSKAQQQDLAILLGITPRRFGQIYAFYKRTGQLPTIGRNHGRPKKPVNPEHRKMVLETYAKYSLNALYLEKVIYAEKKIRIPHNTIHKMLLEEGLAKAEPNKKKRRKAWIRYERKHSLSAVHLDWHEPAGGPKVCAVEDDSSRKILAGGEFEEATAAPYFFT